MTDETAQNTEGSEGVKPTIGDMVGASFKDYEALRSGNDTPSDDDGETTDDTTADGVDTTGSSPGNEDDDGDAGAGNKAADDAHDLPDWAKKRVERAKRSKELARQEADAARRREAEWQRKFEELQANRGRDDTDGTRGTETRGTQRQETDDQPLPADEYNERYDYPEEADYMSGADDQEGLAAYLDDVDRWEQRIPLRGGKHKDDGGQQQQQRQTRQERAQQQQQQRQDTTDDGGQQQQQVDQEQAYINDLFSDLRDSLEEAGESADYDDDIADDFFELVINGQVPVQLDMLEWFADNENAAAAIKAIVEKPRLARRIFRAPESKRARMLADLATGGGETPQNTRRQDNRSGKTVVSQLRGRGPSDSSKALMKAKDFGEYENLRRDMDAKKQGRS